MTDESKEGSASGCAIGLPMNEAVPSSPAVGIPDAERCKRCNHQNAIWSAPSPLWNAVMRGGCINGESEFDDMVCAGCFMVLAEEKGVARSFRVTADRVHVPLQWVTPSGRIWSDEQQIWIDP